MELLNFLNVNQKITLSTTTLFCIDENRFISQGTCNLNGKLTFLNYC